jgi:predicted component of type VI protein secretion system
MSHDLDPAQRPESRHLQGEHTGEQRYNWGLQAIELNLAALANYRCAVRSLQARMRDGTPARKG